LKKAILRVGLGLRFDQVTSIWSLIASLLVEILLIEVPEVDNRSSPMHVMMRWKVPRSRASRLGNHVNTSRIRLVYLRYAVISFRKFNSGSSSPRSSTSGKRSDLAEDEQKMAIFSTTSTETASFLVIGLLRYIIGAFCCVSGFL
jgi:hypothetical protein